MTCRIRILMLLLALLASCGPAPIPIVAEHFQPYTLLWTSLYGPITHSIAFQALTPPTIGICLPSGVLIDPSYWQWAINEEREVLIFHELGHCELGLSHNNNLLNGNIPESIMYPINFGGESYYLEHRQYYLHELKDEEL